MIVLNMKLDTSLTEKIVFLPTNHFMIFVVRVV
jgi:hypothetical protein